jgi:hypothetical protein
MSHQEHDSVTINDASFAVKHRLTEEVFDLYVNRRLAAWLVQALLPTPITANHLTVTAGFLGALCGVLIALGTPYTLGWAAVCLTLSMIFDCADGQLARARGGGSRFGRLLDGASDYTTAVALHLGMWTYLASTGVLFRNRLVDGWGLFAWVLLAGISMALHSGLFDYRKQWLLAHLRPSVSERDDPEDLLEELHEFDGAISRTMLRLYIGYTRLQRQLSHDGGAVSEPQFIAEPSRREEFVSDCRPFFWLSGLIGPTNHNVLIVLATVAAPVFPEAFWWYVLTVAVPMNILFVALVFWGRRLDAKYP